MSEKKKKSGDEEPVMNETAHLEGHLHFGVYETLLILGSIVTYVGDVALDSAVALSYYKNGEILYCLITITLILVPAICIQIFSIRWLQMDLEPQEDLSPLEVSVHFGLGAILYRYVQVLKLGLRAKKTGSPLDYQRYYHKQSDVSMLRLFDSFMESAPQLVFHLYVLVTKSQWAVGLATWAAFSALGSLVSLGSGIASYSSAMRMIQSEKNKMTWTGMILQTTWRFCMLSSRIVALSLLAVALHHYAFVVLFIHWSCMTAWVIWQETDFCPTLWEERFYNAVVGIIYCFCFFNLKEGRSRYRASIFYSVVILENFCFVGVFLWMTDYKWLGVGAFVILMVGTLIGMFSMLLYYGYFHPSGPIKMCTERESYDLEKSDDNISRSPDFVIQDSKYNTPIKDIVNTSSSPTRISSRPPLPPPRIRHSRSFKNPCPPKQRFSPYRRKPADDGHDEMAVENESYHEKLDSAYGTDSNRTVSRSAGSVSPSAAPNLEGEINGSFTNNETYMSIEKSSPMAASTVLEDLSAGNEVTSNEPSYMSVRTEGHNISTINNTYMSVNTPRPLESSQDSIKSNESRITVINRKNGRLTPEMPRSNPEKLLKRSPVVKDITSGFAQISPTDKVVQKRRDFTIIVPHINRFKKSEGILPPRLPPKNASLQSNSMSTVKQEGEIEGSHDYENMALVNINRGVIGVRHWKTYSDMDDEKHDDSVSTERKACNTSSSTDYSASYESMHYYDVYPLSKKLQDKLVKNLGPASESDTYEPIEVLNSSTEPVETSSVVEDDYVLRVPVPITVIHHDGDKITTKRIISMENLKDVIAKHEKVPMDDPQDRSDLYILAPMRLLEPILEESEPGDSSSRSIMTVLSDFLNKTYGSSSGNYSTTSHSNPDGRFSESIDSGSSSLVQTIEEIRNQSLCNLYSSNKSEPGPRVPPRLDDQSDLAPNPNRDKKVPISTSVGSRKNILSLAGTSTQHLLNTPNKKQGGALTPDRSNLSLSPSAKYEEGETPTPPPFSRYVQNRAPCRRKFSIIRERYEGGEEDTTLRPDEKYENFPPGRSAWTRSSLQPRNHIDTQALSQRNIPGRRSMSLLDDKENQGPPARPPKQYLRPHTSSSLSPRSKIFSKNI